VPSSTVLTTLVQRLARLVGLPAALELVRAIPKLSVDEEGNVLGYDHDDPLSTARLLMELYQAVSSEAAPGQHQQTMHEHAADLEARFLEEISAAAAQPTRILLVDDHALVREGLVSLLDPQPDLQVVGQAGSMREAIALARSLRPDVILMDFTLPDGTGDEATRLILSTLPETKIVFLTVHDDDERLIAAISAGAMGYLLKSVRSADLLSRLRDVIRGDVALSPTIGRRILEKLSRQQPPPPAAPPAIEELTEREGEILRLIVQGHTNRQIAEAFNLSVRTVEYHRSNLTSKLGLHSRADLVRYAAEHGLLEGGRPPRGKQ
jgi:DNA-binding NarL/FixJ family response regulator